ncbi:DMT family transporter [Archangium lansingense]|uniref:Multidrug efflux SMR transporter n=1 Tax=Archangium lansingense TaxID=2995310 RepID=A0ABT4ALV1_9BACT|nr:multidrug efflux SMR transporter [Archangium lansinium]MCY1082281.1 multidrug efflux SMR transporter [Archangium lansinium]
MHPYAYLAIAILAEVIATSSLKATAEFTRPWPSLLVAAGYITAFYCLTLSLRVIPVGIAYAVWSGLGIVLVAIASFVLYQQKLDAPAILGMAMILGGCLVINLFSKSSAH